MKLESGGPFFINLVRILWLKGLARIAPAKQSLLRWPCPLPSDRAIPGLWQNLESKLESLTFAHSRARPVPIAALTGYGLPPTATIPAGCSINIGRLSRLEPRTFETGTCAATTRSPTLYRLSYGTGKPWFIPQHLLVANQFGVSKLTSTICGMGICTAHIPPVNDSHV